MKERIKYKSLFYNTAEQMLPVNIALISSRHVFEPNRSMQFA